VREIERGLLISEEILRHLVTVLEDRGPADEIAPAVAQRTTSDLDDGGDADEAAEAEDEELATDASAAAAAEAMPEPEPEPEPELVTAEVTGGEPADEESAEA
jgi:hypothetical protein